MCYKLLCIIHEYVLQIVMHISWVCVMLCYTYFTSMCNTLLHIFHKYVLHTTTHISWVCLSHCYAYFMSMSYTLLCTLHEYMLCTVTHISQVCVTHRYTYSARKCYTLLRMSKLHWTNRALLHKDLNSWDFQQIEKLARIVACRVVPSEDLGSSPTG